MIKYRMASLICGGCKINNVHGWKDQHISNTWRLIIVSSTIWKGKKKTNKQTIKQTIKQLLN